MNPVIELSSDSESEYDSEIEYIGVNPPPVKRKLQLVPTTESTAPAAKKQTKTVSPEPTHHDQQETLEEQPMSSHLIGPSLFTMLGLFASRICAALLQMERHISIPKL